MRYEFLNQQLAGSTACSGRAFQAALSPRLAGSDTDGLSLRVPSPGCSSGDGGQPRLSGSHLRAALHRYK